MGSKVLSCLLFRKLIPMPSTLPRVVLDLEKSRNRCSGLGQFAHHLGHALVDEMTARGLMAVPLVAKEQRHAFSRNDVIISHLWRKEILQRWYRWPLSAAPSNLSLWHATHQQARFLPLNRHTPVILTIHDLNYLREKAGRKIEREHGRIRRLIQRASAVTVISKFVAEEVTAHFDLQERPLKVIYNGRPNVSGLKSKRPLWFQHQQPFMFSIGIIDRKKNFHVLVDLLKSFPEFHLIVAGQNDSEYAAEIRHQATQLGVSERLTLPGPVTDEERQWLYENCRAFVFPSLTEGFGLPPIEAMTVGKPVFLARRTSLPEIGGKWAFYWDDFSPQHMAEVFQAGMLTFDADATYASKLKQAASRFSWQTAARQYVDLYCEVLGIAPAEVTRPQAA